MANRSGAIPLIVPEHVDGEGGVDDYFDLFDAWIPCLAAAYEGGEGVTHRCPRHHP